MFKLRIPFSITVVILGFQFLSSVALANHSVVVTPNLVAPGQDFTIFVRPCPADSYVTIYYVGPDNTTHYIIQWAKPDSNNAVATKYKIGSAGAYVIRASCSGDGHEANAPINVQAPINEAKPLKPTASFITSNSVHLNWSGIGGATSYQVWYQEDGANPRLAGTTGGFSFNLINLNPSTKYSVWTNACNDTGCSLPSDSETFTTLSSGRGSNLCCPPNSRQEDDQCVDLNTGLLVAPLDPSSCNPPGGNPSGGAGGSGDLLDGLRSIISSDKQVQKFGTLGMLVSKSLTVVFMLAGLMMFIWAAVGIFQYISSGGNKEGLAKARARITWSIVGFVFILASFVLTKYVQELLNPNLNTPLTEVTEPKK